MHRPNSLYASFDRHISHAVKERERERERDAVKERERERERETGREGESMHRTIVLTRQEYQ
jgi:hypothetical protein